MRQTILGTCMVLALLMFAGCSSGGGKGSNGDGTDGTSSETNTSTDTNTPGGTDSNSDSASGSGSDTSHGTDTDECAALPYSIEINPINMLVLLDRSRSMEVYQVDTDTNDSSDTFAAVVSSALKQVVSTYDASDLISFGLAVFPSLDCPAGDVSPGKDVQCKPASTDESPLVEIAPDNSEEVEQQLDLIGTCGGTPISASLSWAGEYIGTLPAEVKAQPTYVLLATDGAPNCNADINTEPDVCRCTQPDGNCTSKIQCLDDSATYNAATQLAAEGIKVFVIGVGSQLAAWDDVMNSIASAGGTGTYYPANNPATLNDALEAITGEAVECTFDVDWSSVPEVDEKGNPVDKRCNKVRVFGLTKTGQKDTINYSFECEDSTGWQWQGLNTEMNPDVVDTTPLEQCGTIELCPDACKALKQATYATVTASFGCGVTGVY